MSMSMRVSQKQNSLFPLEPVIKCLINEQWKNIPQEDVNHVFPIFLAVPHCVLKVNALLLTWTLTWT